MDQERDELEVIYERMKEILEDVRRVL